MRFVLALALLIASPVVVQAQTPPVVNTGHFFAWDYLATELTAGAVERFELQLDGGTWVSAGMNTATDASTPAGHVTFRVPIPSMTPGTHSFAIRACNAIMCGAETQGPGFTFTVVPSPPVNLRIQITTAK